MIIITNPVQARAYGRALAWLGDCELKDPTMTSVGEVPTFYNRVTDETRACPCYTAKWEDDHLRDHNGIAFFYDQAKAIAWLRDERLHTVRATIVDGTRLSKSNQPHQYSYFHNQQVELGITSSHPLYIHPFDRIPKDHFIALLLKGEEVVVGPLHEIAYALRDDESLIRNLAAQRYTQGVSDGSKAVG